jgi:glycosyltransferase involved in cell wall biosynthesis
MSRPKLLFLSHRLPFPPHNGAAIRTYNVLRLLSRHYELTALCFDRPDAATSGMPQEQRVRGLAAFAETSVFPIPQLRSRVRLVWDHVRSLASAAAYTQFVYDSRGFADAVGQHVARGEFDLFHVDSLDLVRHLPALPREQTILTHHNTESALLRRRAGAEASSTRRWYLGLQARLLEGEERHWASRVGLNVVVSKEDADTLQALAGGGRFVVVPNGVDTDYFRPSSPKRSGIVFVGGTNYFPNLDALRWFHSEVLPELRRRGCQAEARFVGRATPTEQAQFGATSGLTLTGYVDDVRPFVDEAACFVAPLRVGGGTRLKIVDAWSMGKAIVSTSIGAEGLATREGVNILLRDTAASFAEAIIQVLQDSSLRCRLESAARRTAEEVYSWEVIDHDMHAAYEGVRLSATANDGSLRD